MSHFDAKILDTDIEGMALLAAVLNPSRAAETESRERGRQRMVRAGSFADAFVSKPGIGRSGRRSIKFA